MALCFKEEGRTYVPFDYKDRRELPSRWVRERHGLPPQAQKALEQLEALDHRVSDGQAVEDWNANGSKGPPEPETDWDRHERKVNKMGDQLMSMAERMEALLAKEGL